MTPAALRQPYHLEMVEDRKSMTQLANKPNKAGEIVSIPKINGKTVASVPLASPLQRQLYLLFYLRF
jgi:predicted metalloenzyme YecM